MTLDLLVLVEPGVHRAPVEGEVIEQPGRLLERLGVAPDRVLGDTVAGPDRPVGGIALERAVGRVVGRFEQVLPDVLAGDVELGKVGALVQELRAVAVEHSLRAEHPAHAAREGLEQEPVRGPVDAVVGGFGWGRGERASEEGEGHVGGPVRSGLGRGSRRVRMAGGVEPAWGRAGTIGALLS